MKTDVAHEKYLKMMTEIEDLEDKIETLEKKGVEADKLVIKADIVKANDNRIGQKNLAHQILGEIIE